MNQIDERPVILIVDDVPGNIKTLAEILKNDYQLIMATCGKNALKAVSMKKINLILLDITMPEMDGYDVIMTLKSQEKSADIPVIFITGRNDVENELKGFALGAADFIVKPFHSKIVKARVNTQIELKRSRDLLQELAGKDGLTGIPNRRKFDEYLTQAWYAAVRSNSALSIIMMDVDFFKLYNDNYGHTHGDECLKQVAVTLMGAKKRPTDFIARYGGEEFVCILPGTSPMGASLVGERILQAIASLNIPHAHSSVADYITLSLGAVTVKPSLAISPEEIIKAADTNLYIAKKEGRNRLVCSSHEIPILKILLVEDDESIMDIYCLTMAQLKIPAKIIKAVNGVEGLLLFEREKPDVMITDISMPELDGVLMINKLNEIGMLEDVNVVVITSLDKESIDQKGGLPVKIPVFFKPFSADDIKKLLMEIVGLHPKHNKPV